MHAAAETEIGACEKAQIGFGKDPELENGYWPRSARDRRVLASELVGVRAVDVIV